MTPLRLPTTSTLTSAASARWKPKQPSTAIQSPTASKAATTTILSPVYPFGDTTVLYGSASNLVGVDAIGGVINFQTLDPTPVDQTSFTQGYGTFQQLSTSLRGTGTVGKLGYAVAFGTGYLDGPFRNANFYQPGAAFDQSVLSGPIHDLGVYTDDSATTIRAGLVKFVYNFDPKNSLTYSKRDELPVGRQDRQRRRRFPSVSDRARARKPAARFL